MKRTVFVASAQNPVYDEPMAKAKKFDLEDPAPILDDEDEETLAAGCPILSRPLRKAWRSTHGLSQS